MNRLSTYFGKGGNCWCNLSPCPRRYPFAKFRTSKLRCRPARNSGNFLSTEERNTLVESCVDMVYFIAGKMKGVDDHYRDDLESDGFMALLRAARLWNPNRGVKFSSYAYQVIRQQMLRKIIDDRNADKQKPKEFRVRNKYYYDEQRSVAELFAAVWPEQKKYVTEKDRKELLGRMLKRLGRRLGTILLKREEGWTLKQLGKRFRVSKERIRQNEAAAMLKLRTIREELGIDWHDLFDEERSHHLVNGRYYFDNQPTDSWDNLVRAFEEDR